MDFLMDAKKFLVILICANVYNFANVEKNLKFYDLDHSHFKIICFPSNHPKMRSYSSSHQERISHNLTTFHHEHEGPLLVNVTIANETRSMVLNPVDHFYTERTIVERRKRDVRHIHKLKPEASKCHYHGTIMDDPTSRVAVSTCNGLTGFIHTKNGKYLIEPEHTDGRRIQPTDKHFIYKRSTAIYHHRDNNKQQRRKIHKKPRNCGTHEHPRITQLEWDRRIGDVAIQEKKAKVKNRLPNKQRVKKPMGKKRSARSVSSPRYVETLIVADESMVEFHQDGDIETYLLTIMNMVSSLYLDPSIGNPISVVVVKIIILEDTESTLNVTTKAEITLKNFCHWQNSLKPPDDSHDTYHHDAAILITRKDICTHQTTSCNTLGIAHIGGMCDSKKSCSVNKDSGINLAHTIAHELGHNFGMYHDNEKVGCNDGDAHVMTPVFMADSKDVVWSHCSRRDITHFLDKGLGTCLDNNPNKSEDYHYPELPAGAMYNANKQCWLQFGPHSKACGKIEDMCFILWCEEEGICKSRLLPAAPGTQCGKHKWCQNRRCVDIIEPPDPIDGGWGEWSAWSECSRTCGAGISTMQRDCDHPSPSSGGRFCVGERKRYRICNTDPCSIQEPSFRAVQCSSFNNQTVEGRVYTWYPFFNKDEPCELYCSDSNDTIIMSWGEQALDGTPCSIGRRDLCVSGVCKKVGCDWAFNSTAEEDECGVCQGNGSQCNRMEGVYMEQSTEDGYKVFTTLPLGARNILVEEINSTKNFLAVGSGSGKEFYLNGKRRITVGGEYVLAGAQALYERESDVDKLKIPGPIEEPLALYVMFQGDTPNPGVKYQYTVPKSQTKTVEYTWILSDWSQCSSTCGGGTQIRVPLCQESIVGTSSVEGSAPTVDENSCNVSTRPKQLDRSCSEKKCQTNWWIGPWQHCTVICGYKGVKATRRRSVMCTDEKQMALPDQHCDSSTKPIEHEQCKETYYCKEVNGYYLPV